MANCCICGQKIGRWEDKMEFPGERFACYKCKASITYMKDTNKKDHYNMFKKQIQDKMDACGATDETKKIVNDELDKIIGFKEEVFRQVEIIKQKQEEIIKQKQELLVTTGYNFEGYRITKYLNLVHGEIVLGTGIFSELDAGLSDLFGGASTSFGGKLTKAKQIAQENMSVNALVLGANAIIGVDFDVTTFSNNMIAVSANGTAVVIEKKPKKKEIERC